MGFLKRLDLLLFVALALIALAVAAAVAWTKTDSAWVDSLAPNIVTESVGIAVVLTVIDGVLRRRDRRRVQPLVDYALGTVGMGFLSFVTSLVLDHAATHVYPEVLPRNAARLLSHWLEEEPKENAARVPIEGQRYTTPVGAAVEFAESTYRTMETNRHDMPVELVIAAKQMVTSVSLVVALLDSLGPTATATDLADAERQARRGAVAAVGRFAVELQRVRSEFVNFDMPDYVFSAAETLRRRALGLDAVQPTPPSAE